MINKVDLSAYKIEPLNKELPQSLVFFLEEVFHLEQNIPKGLIPLEMPDQKWWCLKGSDNRILGLVAVWKEKSDWHWGRLAVHKEVRGLGLGKKLVIKSLDELFQTEIEKIVIDARDITVRMLQHLGGKITGEKSVFYGAAITPMELKKGDYLLKKSP